MGLDRGKGWGLIGLKDGVGSEMKGEVGSGVRVGLDRG